MHDIQLDDYEVANLRAAIEAAGYSGQIKCSNCCSYTSRVPRNPLCAMHNGDWLGQIYNKLPEVAHKPNVHPEVMARFAMEIADEERVKKIWGYDKSTRI